MRRVSDTDTPSGVSRDVGSCWFLEVYGGSGGRSLGEASGPGEEALPGTGAKESSRTTKFDPIVKKGKELLSSLHHCAAVCNKTLEHE